MEPLVGGRFLTGLPLVGAVPAVAIAKALGAKEDPIKRIVPGEIFTADRMNEVIDRVNGE